MAPHGAARTPDEFLEDYLTPVAEELPPDDVRPRLVPREPVALGGLVVLEDRAMRGWVTVRGTQIHDITTRKPSGVRTLQTGGVVIPGLLDMHNHPDFNVFAPWEPPETFPNRYEWRDHKLYELLVKAPNRLMKDRLTLPGARLQYAEIRSMVGGATAVQGVNGTGDRAEPLVRNLDRFVFGQHRARTIIDLPAKVDGFGWETYAAALKGIDEKRVDAFYVHLAEGQRDDPVSRAEFAELKEFDGLRPQTVIIHGTALTPAELGEAADVGAKLVWSPQSNLRLYRQTTDVKAALDAGLPVCLGADWLPSGSLSLLAEMKVAAQQLHEQGVEVDPAAMVAMVTSVAADAAGLGDHLGRLAPGRPADLVVLSRLADDAHESVLRADTPEVELVMIGGDLTYVRRDWAETLAPGQTAPNLLPVVAWGRQMLLDNGFREKRDGAGVPTLDDLRADLISVFPQLGPIWA